MRQYYKWLKPDRMPAHGGVGQWPEPGVWAPRVKVNPCRSGYHVCRVEHLSRWIPRGDAELWTVDVRGEFADGGDKHVWGEARLGGRLCWPPNSRQLVVSDFAASVLYVFEQEYPVDMRPRLAIVASREHAAGQISAAARDAVWAAAGAAAWDAERAAAGAAVSGWHGERILYYADCAERGIEPEPWPLPEKPKELE